MRRRSNTHIEYRIARQLFPADRILTINFIIQHLKKESITTQKSQKAAKGGDDFEIVSSSRWGCELSIISSSGTSFRHCSVVDVGLSRFKAEPDTLRGPLPGGDWN